MKSKYKKLEQLYKKIPEIECKGLCHESCTIIPASKIETKRARERMGGKSLFKLEKVLEALKQNNEDSIKIPSCPALKDKRCSIYNVRPAICRLYGVAEGLECPFGCKPKKTISRAEVNILLKEIEAL